MDGGSSVKVGEVGDAVAPARERRGVGEAAGAGLLRRLREAAARRSVEAAGGDGRRRRGREALGRGAPRATAADGPARASDGLRGARRRGGERKGDGVTWRRLSGCGRRRDLSGAGVDMSGGARGAG